MIKEINIKVGKIYSIKYIIEEMKKYPDIKLGHIFALNKHLYHLGIEKLEELQKVIKKAEKDNMAVYDLYGRRRIEPSDITILGIIDPYSKYEKYGKFYEAFYKQIEIAIDASDSGVVMAPSGDILSEARKEGFEIEKSDDLFNGIFIYFSRRGIESRHVLKGKEGEREEYVIFGREGTITREEKVQKKLGDY